MVKRSHQPSITDEFVDALGMSTNVYNPGPQTARRLLNVHSHDQPGKLNIRPGYSLKYSPPSQSNLTSAKFMGFDMFFDRQVEVDGREITCEIQKGTIKHVSTSSATDDDDLKGFWFWCRPYYNGVVWIDEWELLNDTIITSISTAPDSTYKSMFKINGGTDDNIENDTLIGWTVYNKTKDEFARIITCKSEGTAITRLNISLFDNDWEENDILLISKNWIDLSTQAEFYNSVTRENLAFHNLPNNLRIGFGGYSSREGLAIGLKLDYLQIGRIDFPDLHSDLEETDAIEKFSKSNRIILDTHILSQSPYGVDLTVSDGGSLDTNTYYVRITGKADGYAEQLIASNFVAAPDNSKLAINAYLKLGKDNPRLTDFKIYISTDDVTYNLLKSFTIRQSSYYSTNWIIDSLGRLIQTADISELNIESNAASIDDESNSVGSWTVFEDGNISVASEGDGGSSYSLDFDNYVASDYSNSAREGIKFPISALKAAVKKGNYYTINLSLKANIPFKKIYAFFVGSSLSPIGRTQTVQEVTKDFTNYSFDVLCDDIEEDPAYLVLAIAPVNGNDILVFSNNGVNRSKDGGVTFTLNDSDILPSYYVLYLGDRILALSGTSIYASFDGGDTFSEFNGGFVGTPSMLKVIGDIIYAGDTDGGLFKSTDKGASWTSVNSDISGSGYSIYDLVKDDTYLYAATDGGGVYRSDDDGVSFSAANTGLTDTIVTNLFLFNGYVFAASTQSSPTGVKLWRSDDNADNWSDITGGTVSGNFLSSFGAIDSTIFISTYDSGGVYKSDDNGDTWSSVSSGLSETDFKYLFIRNGIIYIGTSDSTAYYSDDDGANWTLLDATVSTPEVAFTANDNTFQADLISIKEKDGRIITDLGDIGGEMNAVIGYNALDTLVKGWDWTLELSGRIYYFNPYTDSRKTNFVYVSHIHSDNSFMWDLASASNFREIGLKSSDSIIGAVLLPTTEILIIKDKSAQILQDDGLVGILREPIEDVTCVARATIIIIGGTAYWCGLEELFAYGPSGIKPLLKDTIRDIYLALTDKNLISATRDRFNTYRIRISDEENKTEFLLTENGWDEESRYDYAVLYKQDYKGKLNFMSLTGQIFGTIYSYENIGYGKLYATKYGQRL